MIIITDNVYTYDENFDRSDKRRSLLITCITRTIPGLKNAAGCQKKLMTTTCKLTHTSRGQNEVEKVVLAWIDNKNSNGSSDVDKNI